MTSPRHPTLSRIRNLLTSSAARFTPNPVLQLPLVEAWEAAYNLRLPNAYRQFLTEIGNGGSMPGDYTDLVIRELAPPPLEGTFPITRDQLTQRLIPSPDERFDEPFFAQLEPFADEEAPPGCLNLGHYPSYDWLFLVVRGELAGTVWCRVREGIPELDQQRRPLDFLQWLEVALLDLCK